MGVVKQNACSECERLAEHQHRLNQYLLDSILKFRQALKSEDAGQIGMAKDDISEAELRCSTFQRIVAEHHNKH